MPRPAKKPAPERERVPKVPEAKHIRVRELRSHFKSLLAEGAPLIVGSHWSPKAIVLPVLGLWHYGADADEIRAARLRALLEAALENL
jgi:hypothetical protein